PRPLVLANQPGLLDPDLEMVPREQLVRGPLPMGVEVGVAFPLAQGGSPIAVERRSPLDEIAHPPVAAGEERLEVRLPRILMKDTDVREAADPRLDRPELGLEASDRVERGPLERGPRLRHERADRQGQSPEGLAV